MNESHEMTIGKTAKGWRDVAGFSFIDVLLALVVLTVGVLALADLKIVANAGNTSSKRMTTALTLAETQLEQIKGLTYGNVVASGPAQVTASGLTFTEQVQVTNNSPVLNVKTVKVIVTWSDAGGTHTVPMSTVIAQ
jgi:type IV pilus assembly protein PilV